VVKEEKEEKADTTVDIPTTAVSAAREERADTTVVVLSAKLSVNNKFQYIFV